MKMMGFKAVVNVVAMTGFVLVLYFVKMTDLKIVIRGENDGFYGSCQ